jgi:hypothetical protein
MTMNNSLPSSSQNTRHETDRSPYGQMAQEMREMDYSPIVINHKSKVPTEKGWQGFCVEPDDEDGIDMRIDKYPGANIGHACGAICFLDADTNDAEMLKAIGGVFNVSPIKRLGSKGYAAAYRQYPGQELRRHKWFTKDGVCICEIIGYGGQVVVPPSIHPDTQKPYQWIGEGSMDTVEAKELPHMPPNAVELLDVALGAFECSQNRKPRMSDQGELLAFGAGRYAGGTSDELRLNSRALHSASIDGWLSEVLLELPKFGLVVPNYIYRESGYWSLEAVWRSSNVEAGKERGLAVSTHSKESGFPGIKDHSRGDTFTPYELAMRLLSRTDDALERNLENPRAGAWVMDLLERHAAPLPELNLGGAL